MKEFNLKYGREKMEFSIPAENLLAVLESSSYKQKKTDDEIILEALANPIASKRLSEIVAAGEKVCIVISDITRSWQKMDKYLYHLVDELNNGGIRDEDIIFLSATGSHRKQTKEEHDLLLGEKLADRFKVFDHDALDEDSLIYLGETKYNTPVKINKLAMEADHIVLTGAIVFHLLAGWAGGKKSILPGIAGYETIMANHAMSLGKELGSGSNPEIKSGKIENNSIYEDMLEAAAMVGPAFILNVIMNPAGNFAQAVAGDFIAAHEEGCKKVDQLDSVVIKERADLVIATAGGYPKDINFYQTIKTIINAKEAIKENGVMIILSECSEGFGNEPIREIIQNYETVIDREKYLRQDYSIAKYVGYYVSEIAEDYNIILVSSMGAESVANAGIYAVNSVEEALKLAYKIKGDQLKTYVMPQGANTFPRLLE